MTKVPPIHWPEVGLVQPAPAYETESYNTSLCKLNPTEFALFEFVRKRVDVKLKALLREIMDSQG